MPRVALPLLLKGATESSAVLYVPLGSAAPTATTKGSMAGLSSMPAVGPRLPAATMTTIPLRQAFSTAAASGSTW